MTKFTWYQWHTAAEDAIRPVPAGDVFIDLGAIVSIGPDEEGVRLVTTTGGSAYGVNGAEVLKALGLEAR